MKRRGIASVLSQFGRTSAVETDIYSWWSFVLAGRLFNQVAMKANIAGKFDLNVSEDQRENDENTHTFPYILPWDQPKDEINKVFFQVLLSELETRNYEDHVISNLVGLCSDYFVDENVEGSDQSERRRQESTFNER